MDPNQTFPEQRPSTSRTTSRRKSPPPTFINLDDCKPILATTTTNTSTNSSNHGTTAFVFTSSRTLRALQDREDRRASPGSPPVPSPATPPTPSTSSSCASRHRAQLTLTQLTKHSEGAIDARALIGPKMRAAGFVNLPHTFASRSEAGFPGALSQAFPVSSHFPLMPSDPPNFPPVLFVNPSVAATLPWDYQREVPWSFPSTNRATEPSGLPSSETVSNEPTPGTVTVSASLLRPPPAPPPLHRDNMLGSSGSSGSECSGLFSSSGSSFTLFSSQSSPSAGLTSVEEIDEEEYEVGHKGKARAKELEPSEFPFPAAYEQSPRSARSHGSRASSATASPTIYAGPGPATRSFSSVQFSTASSPSTHWQDIRITRLPPPLLPSPALEERRERPKTTEKPSQLPTRSFISAKPAKSQRQYSLTELCDSSPLVWLTTSDIFVPPAPIARSPIRASSLAPSSLSISASRPRPAVKAPPNRRHVTAPDTVPTLASTTERHHRIPSTPLRHHPIPSKRVPVPSDQDSGETKASRGGKQDLAKDSSRAGGAEIHRWSDGVAAADSKSRGQESAGSGTGRRARGRDTRGKSLGASETEEERAAAGKTESGLEQARQGLTASVLAHRERDREYARHVAADRERDKLVKQKQRAHRKLRGDPLRDDAQSESESTMVDQPFTAAKSID
ncbi:hypothetical protein TRAPUB_1799 [Trametes pubescens]|uniref:Uncharacterized protein n=1 Tax=Trametes pubescens TaxID=154538 RepID=A0A1M2VII9_TRAPU|nr:hypothetical protein TRAPUB_1799 [Trametes pubescens]